MSSLTDRRFYRDYSSAQPALAKSGAYFLGGSCIARASDDRLRRSGIHLRPSIAA